MSWCIAIVNPFNIAKLAIFLEHRAWRIRRRCYDLKGCNIRNGPLPAGCHQCHGPRRCLDPQTLPKWDLMSGDINWLVGVWLILMYSLYGVVCCKQLKSSFAVSVSTVSFLAWLMTNVYQWSPAMMPCIERPLDPKPKPFSTVPEMYIQLHFGAILQRVSSRKSYGLGSERAPSGKSICPSQLWKTSSKCPRR